MTSMLSLARSRTVRESTVSKTLKLGSERIFSFVKRTDPLSWYLRSGSDRLSCSATIPPAAIRGAQSVQSACSPS